jgi:maltooligosyltrehalose trehalohydrolase
VKIGANYLGGGACEFTVWAPHRNNLGLKIVHPYEGLYPMYRDMAGYWRITLNGIHQETRYFYKLDDDAEHADPASSYQPFGIMGPSQVVDHIGYQWDDSDWMGISVSSLIIYEIHIGTFTKEGTFESAISKLDYLKNLGITAIEIMPVSQFPGKRNWGYDGVFPFAPQNTYGGPNGLKLLVH